MKRSPRGLRTLWLFVLLGTCFLAIFWSAVSPKGANPAKAMPWDQNAPTPTPTLVTIPEQDCPWPGSCPVARYYGYQPIRDSLRSTFNDAARNSLSGAPIYPTINDGVPPNVTPKTISSNQPFPNVLLRAVAGQESKWKQFADDEWSDPDGQSFCTLVSPDCGYGIMQQTSGMGGGSWFDPVRVSKELNYSLGTGTGWLIGKWNYMSEDPPYTSGSNDHTMPEDWYYSVMAYNGWSACNEPNRDYAMQCGGAQVAGFDPWRYPFGEKEGNQDYMPYQETIWGWMAHPGYFPGGVPLLWRETQVAWVPRGIWGLKEPGNWRPYTSSPRPVFTLLQEINVTNSVGPTIVLHNTQDKTLAADVALYNSDDSFSRWWLGTPPGQTPLYRYVRIDPYSYRLLDVGQSFASNETFSGYARVSASEGVQVFLQPEGSYKVFLPVAFRTSYSSCGNAVENPGFELFTNGQPASWTASSSDGYALADGTWFRSGHYGAHLGGYNDDVSGDVDDELEQPDILIPGDYVRLTYYVYLRGDESSGQDVLKVWVRDPSDQELLVSIVSSSNPKNVWLKKEVDIGTFTGAIDLIFRVDTNDQDPTTFFVDDVEIITCGGK